MKSFISKLTKKATKQAYNFCPEIFNLSNKKNLKKANSLFNSNPNIQVVDDYEEQLNELFAIDHPSEFFLPNFQNQQKQYIWSQKKKKPLWQHGNWIWYPWLNCFTHVLAEEDFIKVRTARNQNLISKQEQKQFYNCVVGIGGLSIGNSVALALTIQGGARHIKLADFDNLALSNTNRIRAGVQNLGLPKVIITARQIYEINPYSKVEIYLNGLNEKNLDTFFKGLDVVIDELDNLPIKYLIRKKAKKFKIPVVMAADNGDNSILDIERYDKDAKLDFFHGKLKNNSYKELLSLNKINTGKIITKLVGPENITQKMQSSLLEIGKTIVSWPQLGGAAQLNGTVVAYCIRKIANNQALEKNRSIISLDEKLDPNFNSIQSVKKRENNLRKFKNKYKL